MSKNITIPATVGNRVTVILNGKRYDLATGTQISVPDEVAALFTDNDANAPQDGREPMPWNNGSAAGGGGSVLVVNVTESAVGGTPVYTADKTAGEMYEAAQTGVVVYHTINPLNGLVAIEYLTLYGYLEGTYAFGYSGASDGLTASSSTDYPTGTGDK